jgi:putative transposase
MDGSIGFSASQSKSLLRIVRHGRDPEQRLRAHILLLLDRGHPWNLIVAVLFTSTSTIARWRRCVLRDGPEAVLRSLEGPSRHRSRRFHSVWIALVFRWVTTLSPPDFGFVRSRWTCGTLALLLAETHGVQVSRETVRRWLHQRNLVWRRPRPVLGPKDPRRNVKLRKIRALLRNLPPSETAVFQDEVDINTNPKIGSMWMLKGQQAEVMTPGTNTKRYLAGSLDWRTGRLRMTLGTRRNTDLFLAHLDDLRRLLRRYRRIHVICDNAIFHDPERTKRVAEYLAKHGERIVLHFLPTYSPDTNPIERVWWHLHEEVTRNHRCKDIDALLDMVFNWLAAGSRFEIETSVYDTAMAA